MWRCYVYYYKLPLQQLFHPFLMVLMTNDSYFGDPKNSFIIVLVTLYGFCDLTVICFCKCIHKTRKYALVDICLLSIWLVLFQRSATADLLSFKTFSAISCTCCFIMEWRVNAFFFLDTILLLIVNHPSN